jgi:hypothetical protein
MRRTDEEILDKEIELFRRIGTDIDQDRVDLCRWAEAPLLEEVETLQAKLDAIRELIPPDCDTLTWIRVQNAAIADANELRCRVAELEKQLANQAKRLSPMEFREIAATIAKRTGFGTLDIDAIRVGHGTLITEFVDGFYAAIYGEQNGASAEPRCSSDNLCGIQAAVAGPPSVAADSPEPRWYRNINHAAHELWQYAGTTKTFWHNFGRRGYPASDTEFASYHERITEATVLRLAADWGFDLGGIAKPANLEQEQPRKQNVDDIMLGVDGAFAAMEKMVEKETVGEAEQKQSETVCRYCGCNSGRVIEHASGFVQHANPLHDCIEALKAALAEAQAKLADQIKISSAGWTLAEEAESALTDANSRASNAGAAYGKASIEIKALKAALAEAEEREDRLLDADKHREAAFNHAIECRNIAESQCEEAKRKAEKVATELAEARTQQQRTEEAVKEAHANTATWRERAEKAESRLVELQKKSESTAVANCNYCKGTIWSNESRFHNDAEDRWYPSGCIVAMRAAKAEKERDDARQLTAHANERAEKAEANLNEKLTAQRRTLCAESDALEAKLKEVQDAARAEIERLAQQLAMAQTELRESRMETEVAEGCLRSAEEDLNKCHQQLATAREDSQAPHETRKEWAEQLVDEWMADHPRPVGQLRDWFMRHWPTGCYTEADLATARQHSAERDKQPATRERIKAAMVEFFKSQNFLLDYVERFEAETTSGEHDHRVTEWLGIFNAVTAVVGNSAEHDEALRSERELRLRELLRQLVSSGCSDIDSIQLWHDGCGSFRNKRGAHIGPFTNGIAGAIAACEALCEAVSPAKPKEAIPDNSVEDFLEGKMTPDQLRIVELIEERDKLSNQLKTIKTAVALVHIEIQDGHLTAQTEAERRLCGVAYRTFFPAEKPDSTLEEVCEPFRVVTERQAKRIEELEGK